MGETVKRAVLNRVKNKIGESTNPKDVAEFRLNKLLEPTRDKLKMTQSLADDPLAFIKQRIEGQTIEKAEQEAGILNPRRMIRNQLLEEGFEAEDIDRILSTMTFVRDGEEITETPGVSRGILG